MTSSARSWTFEKLYTVQDDYFHDLIANINAATFFIEMETYIFEKGVLADRVAKALCDAADRGVHVRLLIDGIGSPNFVNDYEKTFSDHGVHVRYYRILPWIFRHLPGEPRFFLGKIFYRLARLNKGNHRKMCLIDKKALWVGSANVSDVHLREVRGDKAWRDLGVHVEGDDISLAHRAFDQAFLRGRALRLKLHLPRLLSISQTFFQRHQRRAEQLQRLQQARKRIWIETPYFVPLARVVRRLLKKAREGVDVRILVPLESDVWVIPWISYSYLRLLAAHGVKVYEYEPGFVHQKLYLIDDWICLGSTNLNHRSFLHDLELDVVITHEENKKCLENMFLDHQSQSIAFPTALWATFPWWKKLLYNISWYFSYWA
jgi:cardiolipin synthase